MNMHLSESLKYLESHQTEFERLIDETVAASEDNLRAQTHL